MNSLIRFFEKRGFEVSIGSEHESAGTHVIIFEEKRLHDLENQADRWFKSDQLRQYISAVETAASEGGLSTKDDPLRSWLECRGNLFNTHLTYAKRYSPKSHKSKNFFHSIARFRKLFTGKRVFIYC